MKRKQYYYALLSVFFWSTSSIAIKILGTNLTSMKITTGITFFATIGLFLILSFQKKLSLLKKYTIKDLFKIFLLGFIGIFLYNIFFNEAIVLLPAQEANTINYTWPIMIMIFAIPLLKEKFNLYKLIAITLSFLGVIIIITKGNLVDFELHNIKGAVLAICAAICYGLFSVLAKKFDYDRTTSTFIYFFSSFILCLFITNFNFPTINLKEIVLLSWLGIFTEALTCITWALALKYGNTAKISNLAFLTPIIATILTVIILKEQIHLYFILGLILILSGIVIQSKIDMKNN